MGLPLDGLVEALMRLGLEGWRLETQTEMRGPFRTTRLRVHVQEGHYHHAAGGHAHHRHLSDVLEIIASSTLPEGVKFSAARVFRRLAEAEARVHGNPVEEVHFHEVGALDSIIDIVGACAGIHLLKIDEVRSGPVTVGTGFVQIAHGKIPLPAPATLELLRGFPVEQRDSGAELTTPTGAALLTTLSRTFGTMPPLVISAIGYGAGDDRPGPVPNAIRAILGERTGSTMSTERVCVLETNIDDMSPQLLGHLMDTLFEAGAIDVSVIPMLMKKSRPAHEVKVIVPLEAELRVLESLFSESTTFGVRRMEVDRAVLEREVRKVETPWGPVGVKVGYLGGRIVTASPEYEDVREAARRAGLPLKTVHEKVTELFHQAKQVEQ